MVTPLQRKKLYKEKYDWKHELEMYDLVSLYLDSISMSV